MPRYFSSAAGSGANVGLRSNTQGPIKDPVKNVWVVEFGMIACVLVIPLALICGPLRGVPWFWRLIDCSFGVFGLVPLEIARRMIVKVAQSEPRP
jgi:hypothetical protein